MRVGLVAAGLSCLTIADARAQQREIERERSAAPSQQVQPGQTGQTSQQGQPYAAQFRGTQATTGTDAEVQRFLASCLLQQNKAEVEIGEIAQQQAQNPEVKQFAQRTVKDHQQLVQKLQPLAGAQASAGATYRTSGQNDAQRRASDTTQLPGAGQTSANQSLTANRPTGQQNAALNEIAQIERQIGERCLQAMREELQQKQGAEFDKCYVGSQVGGHMHMLAALEVLEQQGPDQLKQVAQDARPTVEQHLQQAKQLMKQLEGSGSTASQAERQPSRTQR
jgi:predicted outer membrane protein